MHATESIEFLSPGVLLTIVCLVSLVAFFIFMPAKQVLTKTNGATGANKTPSTQNGGNSSANPGGSAPNLHGTFIPSTGLLCGNSEQGYPFDNEFASGLFLATHRPTYDKALDKSGDWIYGEHYKGRKRLWEHRLQICFKKPIPRGGLRFGIELEEYVPLNKPTKKLMEGVVSMLRRVVGNDLYHSVGDNPKEVDGELERPVFAMPLWAFDQFIETPEGETPPDLADPQFCHFGHLRTADRGAFVDIMNTLDLQVGKTYTFAFWGISQFLDAVRWEVKGVVPLVPVDFNTFCGKPPVHLVLYTLNDSEQETRHLQSRKNYCFRLPFWSSKKPPSLDVIRSLVPERAEVDREDNGVKQRKSFVSKVGGAFSCCAAPHRVQREG